MEKIMVIGSSGSGKSTLSRQLGHTLDIPVFHLDVLFWKPNWVMTSSEEQKEIQKTLLQKKKWIIDGSYTGILDERLNAADSVILLDLPRKICFYRVFKRLFKNIGKTRIDMGKDCKERINLTFLKYIWNFPKHRKPYLLQKIKANKNDKKVFVLTNIKEIEQFRMNVEKNDI
ncbi:DNA topology modulation protein [Staphylococcus equorum]|uniref:DNA topology modulation protein n=1 Tax=Staphylococcus equorum TaxID=246432 RepID=UPI0008531CB5|nr:DNA topology modulation protein [Staphylococcus equorum]MEB7835213.1 DNA topology modulation protein [Staphylococcus equorum]MEB7848256.1 DNA topology modulation protein [Staphylococcus equorum]MEB8107595.1 DNA topology modulation protein [Staphylococcus equorum]MEB8172686.1 DNA topology modulation protein [Staphylococcus equorum]OEK75787.1 AAA family ATPase [Staphylococcus equorum]